MAQRIYKPVMILSGPRVFNMKNLWNPSTEYLGKKSDKPNYLCGFIVPKTQAHWSQEPCLAQFTQAMMEIHAATMGQAVPYQAVSWPVKDGDIPEPGKTPAEWAKGHWMISGSSGDAIKVEMFQGGNLVPLLNRTGVKPGDHAMIGGAVAQKANDPRGIKLYINAVTFTQPGEEIAVGNSVTGAELMAQAQVQGLQVAGFSPAGAGGFGAPQGGFAPPQQQMGAPGFSASNGPAPMTGAPAFGGPAPVQSGTAAPGFGGAAFPSSAPGGFAPGPFPPR